MARIELRNLYHSYEVKTSAREKDIFKIENMNLIWEDGTANALLGPSGCGKTTILNIISGLLRPKSGQVFFDGTDVTESSPKERHIAQVFQFPVVYDTMSVYDNLAFPLRNDKMPESQIEKRVEEVADILELKSLIKTPTTQLNATDKQKVAVGRGIVRKNTSAVLLDEPLTVIDHKLRYGIRRKLKQVQQITGMTMIYVTHDQHEALTFADHVTILKGGEVVQSSTPAELYANPKTPFCGYFIGSPGMNFIDCAEVEGKRLNLGELFVPVSEKTAKKLREAKGKIQVGIRPEQIEVTLEKTGDNPLFVIKVIEDTGAYKILTLTAGAHRIKVRTSSELQVSEGNEVFLHFPERAMKFYEDGLLIN
jgi:glycerol transport system ATP-binding protein